MQPVCSHIGHGSDQAGGQLALDAEIPDLSLVLLEPPCDVEHAKARRRSQSSSGGVGHNNRSNQAVAAQTPTLAISPSTVVAGGRVLVTAGNVPANKAGEIQLHSQTYRFPFQASASGAVKKEIVVPADIAPGDHTVEICWDSSCRAHQTLRVVAPGTVMFHLTVQL